jgi:hypothetical protein
MRVALCVTSGLIVGVVFGGTLAVVGVPYAWTYAIVVFCLIAAGGLWVSRDEGGAS